MRLSLQVRFFLPSFSCQLSAVPLQTENCCLLRLMSVKVIQPKRAQTTSVSYNCGKRQTLTFPKSLLPKPGLGCEKNSPSRNYKTRSRASLKAQSNSRGAGVAKTGAKVHSHPNPIDRIDVALLPCTPRSCSCRGRRPETMKMRRNAICQIALHFLRRITL